MRWVAALRERLRGLLFRAREEAEMDEEMRFHLDMEAERLVREAGLRPEEARRQAAVAFGGVEYHKEEVRDARGLAWVAGMSLDFKLGARMLVKYPGLTVVGGLAIAFAIAAGAVSFEVVNQLLNPTIPLDGGDRIVGIRNWDSANSHVRRRASHDFAVWRSEVRSVDDLGAFQAIERNLFVGDEGGEPVPVAEISASAFRLARVAPLLGRPLLESDEEAGAPDVVLIGHGVWQARFAGDPNVVGRTVRLGTSQRTVVGVMPEGFAFPVAHGAWIPLRLGALDHQPGQGPVVSVFGRLAPGATLEEARAELATLGMRAATEFPETHRHLVPQVLPYAESLYPVRIDLSILAGLYSIILFVMMFLALACANVGALVFARTAAREGEIVVRNALGASRGRIVLQLFAEALVLAGFAAVVGLAAANFGLRWGMGLVERESGPLPFWFHGHVSPLTALYVAGLAILGAVIVGVLPAFKVTGRAVEMRLRQAAAGGAGVRFGGMWTRVIIVQVAITVALPAAAYFTRRDAVQLRSLDPGVPAGEYLTARVHMDRDASIAASPEEFLVRFEDAYREMERRLAADPAVAGVTFADRLPGTDHPQRRVEIEGGAADGEPSTGPCRGRLGVHRDCVSSAAVDLNYLVVLGAPILAGRAFHAGDLSSDAGAVIVNQTFVRQVLAGRNPIGRRVRYRGPADPDGPAAAEEEPGPWYEIVGVVKDLAMTDGSDPGESGAGLYHPTRPGAAFPVRMAVHVRGDPEGFAPRLREVAGAVDPGLRLTRFLPLDDIQRDSAATIAFWFRVVLVASGVALLLSLAGIYSVMAFTVSRRTREIGIRAALGADSRRIVAAIFSRALMQVVIGVLAGGALTAALTLLISGGEFTARGAALVLAHMALMIAVCTLACIVPTRRALRIHPTEALRGDG